jgi:hypothetical protein
MWVPRLSVTSEDSPTMAMGTATDHRHHRLLREVSAIKMEASILVRHGISLRRAWDLSLSQAVGLGKLKGRVVRNGDLCITDDFVGLVWAYKDDIGWKNASRLRSDGNCDGCILQVSTSGLMIAENRMERPSSLSTTLTIKSETRSGLHRHSRAEVGIRKANLWSSLQLFAAAAEVANSIELNKHLHILAM